MLGNGYLVFFRTKNQIDAFGCLKIYGSTCGLNKELPFSISYIPHFPLLRLVLLVLNLFFRLLALFVIARLSLLSL